ncbi:MAG: hypothetical protein WC796_05665 [Candidatus Pacearchaeota archaeon]
MERIDNNSTNEGMIPEEGFDTEYVKLVDLVFNCINGYQKVED